MPSSIDITGQRFGCLTALHLADESRQDGKGRIWVFECDCGLKVERRGFYVRKLTRNGDSPSAGPCSRARRGAHLLKHGMGKHPAYRAWRAALNRCTKPHHPNWCRYGGRGITMDLRWSTFEAFWADMGPTWQKGLTLDRRDNNGPYSAENCRWDTWETQYRNTRIVLPVNIKALAAEAGLPEHVIRYRWGKKKSLCGRHADEARETWPAPAKKD